MKTFGRFWLIAMLVCIGTVTHAQSMFKCRLADGSYSYQAERCPESASQQTITANSRGSIKIAPIELSGAKRGDKSSNQPATPTAPLAGESAATANAESPREPTQEVSVPGPDSNTSALTQKKPTSKLKQGFLILLVIVFGLLSLFGLVGLYVAAFRESVVWGLLCLFVPFAMLVFVIRRWEQVKVPFLLSFSMPVAGIALAILFDSGASDKADKADKDMQRLVTEINQKLPQTVGDVRLEKVVYADKVMRYAGTIPGNSQLTEAAKAEFQKKLKSMYCSNAVMRKGGVSVEYTMSSVSMTGTERFSVSAKPEDCKP